MNDKPCNHVAVPYEEAMGDYYRENPDMAIEVLNAALKERDVETFMVILGHICRGGTNAYDPASLTRLNENTLHRMLSCNGNPTFKKLLSIFNALGLTFSVNAADCQRAKHA